MKVGVFAAPGDRDLVTGVLHIARDLGSDGVGYAFGADWGVLDGDELDFNFSSITHFVIILSPKTNGAGWLGFVAGFCLGKHSPGMLLVTGDGVSAPGYLSRFTRAEDLDRLRDALRLEQEMFVHDEAVESARAEISGRGLGLTDEDFCEAAARGDVESVRHYLTLGFSADTRGPNGLTALGLAVRRRQKEMARLLIDRGADVNAGVGGGNTPLMEASSQGDVELVELLLASRADPGATNDNGQTALLLAVGEGQESVVRLLIDAGSPVDIEDRLGMNAGDYATLFHHDRILAALREAGAKLHS